MGTHAKISSADLCLTLERTIVLHVHFPSCVLQDNDVKWSNAAFYYIDTGVLLENTPLVKFIRKYIRDREWRISISRFFTAVYVWVVVCLKNKKNVTR